MNVPTQQIDLPPELMRMLHASYSCDTQVVSQDAAQFLQQIADAGSLDWVKKLEQKLADDTGFSHVSVCGSESVALYLALSSIGLTAGDEVLLSTYSPVFVADVIRHFDAHPILVDIDASSLEIDYRQVEDSISDRTKAIIPVHLAGRPLELWRLANIANRTGIPIIEAVGAAAIGTLGRSSAMRGQFIFGSSNSQPTWSVPNQLGYVCTNDHDAAQRAKLVASQPAAGPQEVQRIHFDCRPAQLGAAWEFQTLQVAQDRWRRRCEIATSYTAVFSGRVELDIPPETQDAPHSWTQYILRLNLQRLPISRIQFVEQLRAAGLQATIGHLPIHMHPYYQTAYALSTHSLPVARNEFLRVVMLPIDHTMTDADIDEVTRTVIGIL
jgi:dTDP-4-amino-4,6-dideoxygalactose transaminase